ncbi:thioredoxin domain-containing protein [Paeniglutamicibacter cryotolerans]|uniref:Spermatogenesis-associated protein 20-like TRX domain-containing protein n=1 Tax=Paeniglutamicibacter cryotolerans TaxID=670079 RepID=A0A839QHS6_9MICC|nr:thioredoxin domain-containing protein [Paeniglutamicibacter cryotolerans]MBB2995928.1 hypothetical protein [Paeniglutamicibacter cryotolerans]
MASRIAAEASAYLRQHADQPVDWWPYGSAAFASARERDVPVFLSIGYAACHWCHVMAGESFADASTAAYLNEHFVAIKVDREERPDVDNTYMAATQTLTGAGGWPMSVFAFPDGRAFHAGTYFPPVPRSGTPSFMQVLAAVREAWEIRRPELEVQADTLAAHLGSVADGQRAMLSAVLAAPGGSEPRHEALDAALDKLLEIEDPTGGFSPAPKFPPNPALDFLLQFAAGPSPRAPEALSLAGRTLEKMALGALHDLPGGGFSRYCVDGQWRVPHFEKMLYDNAQLLGLYSRFAALTPDPGQRELATRAATGIVTWLCRDMVLPGGAFASSLDADVIEADGSHAEGSCYLFSDEQLAELVPKQWAVLAPLLDGRTLESEIPDQDTAHTLAFAVLPVPSQWLAWDAAVPALLAARSARPQPSRDEKVVAAWNGLAIQGLALAAVLLGDAAALDLAQAAAARLWEGHWDASRSGAPLLRVSYPGSAASGVPGLLEDYAAVALGFQALAVASGEERWQKRAALLLDAALELFILDGLPVESASGDAMLLAARSGRSSIEALDDALPSAVALLCSALLDRAGTLAAAGTGGEDPHGSVERGRVSALLGFVPRLAGRVPHAMGASLAVLARLGAGTGTELVLTGGTTEQRAGARALGMLAGVAQPVGAQQRPAAPDGGLAAYVCRGGVCLAPVSGLAALRGVLLPYLPGA